MQVVEDEKHKTIDCPFDLNERETLYSDLFDTLFHNLNAEHKFIIIMSYNNGDT